MAIFRVLMLAVVGLPLVAYGGSVEFKRRFAPQEGTVAPIEKRDRDELCLNGNWQFQPVESKKGSRSLSLPLKERWEKTLIRIPSPWNVNAFPVESRLGGDFRCFPSYPEAWEKVQAGWLRRSFVAPKGWRKRRLILRFNAVAGDTEVFVNGRSVVRHFDIFLPFEADVTDVVRFDSPNELLVAVRKASLSDRQGPYGRRTYQGGSMWGQAIAGIWQDVFLECLPAVRIEDVFVKPAVGADKLSAEVTLKNDTDRAAKVWMGGDVYPWINRAGKDVLSVPEPNSVLGTTAVLRTARVGTTVPAHGSIVVMLAASGVGKSLKTWSPEHPNLYGLVCRLEGDGHDTKFSRFGWREITFRGTTVLLNGQPLVMKGDSWHFMGIPEMTRRYAWGWFRALHDANLNAVRLHAEPYPSFFLDMADEMGILVLDETAIWASDGGPKVDDADYWNDTQRHLRDLILRDRNHPSVFGWSVSNEVMAVVRNVFHAPKAVEDRADRMNGVWASICRSLDPTRVWISADGEEDGHGQLPVAVIHYGDRGTMRRVKANGKPWGVGEAGPAYYGSPKQIAEMSGYSRAYLSFEERMRGVGLTSYQSLMDQREEGASYRSVFNLVWYGLKPLPFGLRDTRRAPELSDGVFFGPFKEGQPGVQPERLGPYCSTLNPGYDPGLPLYETWPLFDAIRAAQAEPPAAFALPRTLETEANSSAATISNVRVLAGGNGTLARSLADLGATVDDQGSFLFVDGANPPGAEARNEIAQALATGGTVVVWGARAATLDKLNAVLPGRLELTSRMASSLAAVRDPLTAGLTPGSLYFSELSPSTVLTSGMGGPLLEGAKILLRACDTDWRRWNGQGETVKTAMVLRSEREAKPSGAALAEIAVGKGRLLVCNLPALAETSQLAAMDRQLLANLGIVLGGGAASQNLLDAHGILTSALVLGTFPSGSVQEALSANPVWPGGGREIMAGAVVDGRRWTRCAADGGGRLRLPGEGERAFAYASFWVYSPKSLDNLLLDPHLPSLTLGVDGAEAARVWINGKSLDSPGSEPLLLQQGWSHVLLKLVAPNRNGVLLQFSASQPAFLAQLRATFEKP